MKNSVHLLDDASGLRQDVTAWVFGIIIFCVISFGIFGLGYVRGWDAQSGHTHNLSATSADRFLPEPFQLQPGVHGRSGPHAVDRWYYWKLPPSRVTKISRSFAWLCYIGHQLTIWATIYYAQRKKIADQIPGPKYTSNISHIQWMPLLLNTFFLVVHLIQTHLTYDATAQDVSIGSSLGSAEVFLLLTMLMECRDRGLAFGSKWPTKQHQDKGSHKSWLTYEPISIVGKYHGYAISWCVIHVFWYHPMENTWSHIFGFCHVWLVLLQGSLMYTTLHLNRLWRFIIEAFIVVHATVTVLLNGSPSLWPMFTFGFLWMINMTQVFGFMFWKKLPKLFRAIPFLIYLAICLLYYGLTADGNGKFFVRLSEITRIPTIRYSGIFFTLITLEMFLRIEKFIIKGNQSESERNKPLTPGWETMYILGFMLVYITMALAGVIVQEYDLQLHMILIMVGFIFVYLFGVSAGFMFLKQLMPLKIPDIHDE